MTEKKVVAIGLDTEEVERTAIALLEIGDSKETTRLLITYHMVVVGATLLLAEETKETTIVYVIIVTTLLDDIDLLWTTMMATTPLIFTVMATFIEGTHLHDETCLIGTTPLTEERTTTMEIVVTMDAGIMRTEGVVDTGTGALPEEEVMIFLTVVIKGATGTAKVRLVIGGTVPHVMSPWRDHASS